MHILTNHCTQRRLVVQFRFAGNVFWSGVCEFMRWAASTT